LIDLDGVGLSFAGYFQEDGPGGDEDHEGEDDPDPGAVSEEFDHGRVEVFSLLIILLFLIVISNGIQSVFD
jgi:hypothetical protein